MKVPFLAGKREISLDSLIPFKCLICLDIIRWSIGGKEEGERGGGGGGGEKNKRARRPTILLNSRSMNRKTSRDSTLDSCFASNKNRTKGRIFV